MEQSTMEATGSKCCCGKGMRKFEAVVRILDKHQRKASRLIPILQAVQEEYRYLPEDVLSFVATSLALPPAKVYGVATFYAHFALKPKGKYVIRLCNGTACNVRGSIAILEALQGRLNVTDKANTTPDQMFTVETVSCLGACGLAPVLMINEDVHGQMTGRAAIELVEEILKAEQAGGPKAMADKTLETQAS